jgi:ZIP family zinc transporter
MRHRARMRHLLGLTAGVLIGVVAFDVLPEIFRLVRAHHLGTTGPMVALVAGFLTFHVLEKLTVIHAGHEEDYAHHTHPRVGVLSALALAGHSFADGAAIGLAFQAGTGVGVTVAVAVIAHDFADGLNTVALMLVNRNSDRRALGLLALDAAAPLAGAATTLLVSAPPRLLAVYLGAFAGLLLYIGAADVLPQAHSARPSGITVALTVAGAVAMFLVARATG